MSERSAEEIRKEIAAERQRLDDDLTALRSEMRLLALFAASGLAVVALVAWRKSGTLRGAATVWKLVR